MATPTPVFPAAIATDQQLRVANNLIQTTLKVAAGAADTILFVNSTAGFAPNCLISVDKEIMAVSGIVASPNPQLIVAAGGRGFDGTTAAAHNGGATVSMLIVAWHHNALATEIKAIEGFIGANGQNITFSGIYISANYAFPAQTPGGTLAPGTNSITLTPVPQGINGTNKNHYLWISGGTGTAEAALITGGTAVSGAASGTVFVTCANAHSGAWTVQSASGGIQEAIYFVPNGQGTILVPNSPAAPATIYATVGGWPSSGNITLIGNGSQSNVIVRASTFTNGDLFLMDGSTGNTFPTVTFRHIGIAQGSFVQSGAAIHGNQVPYVGLRMFDVNISDGQYGIRVCACSLYADGVSFFSAAPSGYKPLAGIFVEGAPNPSSSETTNIFLMNTSIVAYPRTSLNLLTYGLYCTGADGILSINLSLGGDYGMALIPATGHYITNSNFCGVYADGPRLNGILTAGAGPISGLIVTDFYINGPLDTASTSVAISLGGNLYAITFSGGRTEQAQGQAVAIGATGGNAQNIQFSNCLFRDNNQANSSAIPVMYIYDGQIGVRIIGNCFYNSAAGKSQIGINIAGALTDAVIADNSFNLLAGVPGANAIMRNPASALTDVAIYNNKDSSTTPITFASAASVTLPSVIGDSYTYTVSGTTPIATITGGWRGRTITLRFTDPAPGGVTAAGNIYTAKTAAQNATVTLRYDGTKWAVL